jgi:transcriptional regulator with XRE-family HTH domain
MAVRTINTRLKLALLERGISQLQLALDIGYDPSLISKVIRGWERPSRQLAEDVARYLDLPIAELFDSPERPIRTQGVLR